MRKQIKWQRLIEIAPVEWETTVNKMNNHDREELRSQFAHIAKVAAMLEGYLDERYGYGCGDQGHERAMKTANKNGKQVWMKVFGYNGYHELNV